MAAAAAVAVIVFELASLWLQSISVSGKLLQSAVTIALLRSTSIKSLVLLQIAAATAAAAARRQHALQAQVPKFLRRRSKRLNCRVCGHF